MLRVFLLGFIGSSAALIPVKTTVSDGVRSVDFNVMYGDEHMTMINQVVTENQDKMKSRVNLDEELPRLPVEDLKCLISVDRHCSRDMLEMKNILVRALQEDCASCSTEEKDRAGRVVASMMAHDPVAWKLFLTRYDSRERLQRILG